MLDERNALAASKVVQRIIDNVETVIIGKRETIELVVMSLIAQGHVLLEDLPGTGKTSLVSALAKSIACDFNRIQFTPDIMPSDVTGFSIYNQKTRDFEFRAGGVMSNLVLVDEINRASAKTQSALLEAMEERQVTVDSETHVLEEPFMVLATQNPIEQYGTYPLPEAQLDRFLVKLSMGYPLMSEEVKVVLETKAAKARIAPVATTDDILTLRALAEDVHVAPQIARYAVQIVSATRAMKECTCGASPRGSIALINMARANALMRGRVYVMPDDIKYLAPYVLGHRIILTHEAKVNGRDPASIISAIMDSVAVPTVESEELMGARAAATARAGEGRERALQVPFGSSIDATDPRARGEAPAEAAPAAPTDGVPASAAEAVPAAPADGAPASAAELDIAPAEPAPSAKG